MKESETNIIVFRPEAEFPIERRRKTTCKCSRVRESYPNGSSPSVWVDEATRDLECRVCGARIDPFDYLWMLATEGNHLTESIRRMREEKKTLEAQMALLNEQIRELKAQVRKSTRQGAA